MTFPIEHGINPIAPDADSRPGVDRVRENYDVEPVDPDPSEATFVFSLDWDRIEVTVGEALRVTPERRRNPRSCQQLSPDEAAGVSG